MGQKKIYSSISEVVNDLRVAIQDVMANQVYKAVVETESDTVDDVVYAHYDPAMYSRRRESGGLSDPNNMIGSFSASGDTTELNVKNVTPAAVTFDPYFDDNLASPVGKNLPAIVEYGIIEGYDYYDVAKDVSFAEPRPFVHETHETLKNSDILMSALAKGLNAKGFNAR